MTAQIETNLPDAIGHIKEMARPAPVAAAARMNDSTLKRLGETAGEEIDVRSPQPRLGSIALIQDSTVPDDQIWMFDRSGTMMAVIRIS